MSHELIGKWYPYSVDFEHSFDEVDEEEYCDDCIPDFPEGYEHDLGDHAGDMIEFRAEGTYAYSGCDYAVSHGKWQLADGKCDLKLDPIEKPGGFERQEYIHFDGNEISLAYKLAPDAHDGMDIMILKFSRDGKAPE